jgi:zinc/manganese transport system substrate-binding protein
MRLHLNRLLFLLIALPAAVFAACGSDSGAQDSERGIRVVATTTQIGALVREIAGEDVELTILLPAGADAHDYEPNPQSLQRVNEADLVLRHGIGLDDWLEDMIEGAGGDATVVRVTEGIPIRKDADGADDPHVWHNPDFAKTMVDKIARALSEADPDGASGFGERATGYKAKLDEADAEIKQLFEGIPAEDRKLVTNHDAFGYFIERYGLEFVAAVIPSSNKDSQASAKDLAALQEVIEREGVRAIFAEEEVDPKVARELAQDTGVRIVEGLYADSLGEPGSGADTIHGMLLFNAHRIAEGLQ